MCGRVGLSKTVRFTIKKKRGKKKEKKQKTEGELIPTQLKRIAGGTVSVCVKKWVLESVKSAMKPFQSTSVPHVLFLSKSNSQSNPLSLSLSLTKLYKNTFNDIFTCSNCSCSLVCFKKHKGMPMPTFLFTTLCTNSN